MQEQVLEYFNNYFGGNLTEDTTNEDIMDAVEDLVLLTEAVCDAVGVEFVDEGKVGSLVGKVKRHFKRKAAAKRTGERVGKYHASHDFNKGQPDEKEMGYSKPEASDIKNQKNRQLHNRQGRGEVTQKAVKSGYKSRMKDIVDNPHIHGSNKKRRDAQQRAHDVSPVSFGIKGPKKESWYPKDNVITE